MLKKLLKYDLKSLFKYWWIVAATSIALSTIGGFCITILTSKRDFPSVVTTSSGLLLFIAILGIGVFSIFTMITVFIRFYKNLFTDEGYLTFTLPAKRSQILNSKLISGLTVTAITSIMICIDIFVMLTIPFGNAIFSKETFKVISDILSIITEQLGAYFYIYILEFILIYVAFSLLSILFLYACITLASIITKKARVITSIGIYYGVTSIFTLIMQIFLIFGVTSIVAKVENLAPGCINGVIALILLCLFLFTVMLCAVVYSIQYYMIDRKLNLV